MASRKIGHERLGQDLVLEAMDRTVVSQSNNPAFCTQESPKGREFHRLLYLYPSARHTIVVDKPQKQKCISQNGYINIMKKEISKHMHI